MIMQTALMGLTVAAVVCLSQAHPSPAAVAAARSGWMIVAKNGADNAAGDYGGRGQGHHGQGANHATRPGGTGIILARNGADNATGRNKGDDNVRV